MINQHQVLIKKQLGTCISNCIIRLTSNPKARFFISAHNRFHHLCCDQKESPTRSRSGRFYKETTTEHNKQIGKEVRKTKESPGNKNIPKNNMKTKRISNGNGEDTEGVDPSEELNKNNQLLKPSNKDENKDTMPRNKSKEGLGANSFIVP